MNMMLITYGLKNDPSEAVLYATNVSTLELFVKKASLHVCGMIKLLGGKD